MNRSEIVCGVRLVVGKVGADNHQDQARLNLDQVAWYIPNHYLLIQNFRKTYTAVYLVECFPRDVLPMVTERVDTRQATARRMITTSIVRDKKQFPQYD